MQRDLRQNGRIILAEGEVTGHVHEVVADLVDSGLLPGADYFEEPDGRRVLLARAPCWLIHPEHGRIFLDPVVPAQARQGDVLLNPIGAGAWQVVRQHEELPEGLRVVAD